MGVDLVEPPEPPDGRWSRGLQLQCVECAPERIQLQDVKHSVASLSYPSLQSLTDSLTE